MGLVTDLRSPPGTAVATGHRRLLEQLRADGVRYLFGNPGSTEEGLLDELTRFPDVAYVLGLQEAALVSIADGYAQAAGHPAVVLLHSGVGLGNAAGGIYHAMRRQTPMVVLAGEAGVEYDAMDAQMAADLVGMARPITKYATRVIHPDSLLRLFRRCLKVAATPPRGPVFLAVPQDILDQPNEEPVTPTVVPWTRVVPEQSVLDDVAGLLAGARSPVILVGDGVAASGAVAELTRFAETWGAGVYGVTASELLMPWHHPLWRGLTGHMFGAGSAAAVAGADAVLVCGTYLFPEVFPLTHSPFRDGARVVHIDLDAAAIAKNHPVTVGLVSDPRLTLRGLTEAMRRTMTAAQREAAGERARSVAGQTIDAHAERTRLDATRRDRVPLRMSTVAEQLARLLPADAVVFDESLTHSAELTRWLPPQAPGAFFQTPGGTLGVGIPGAVGAKLAHPDRTVVGLTGDGGALYTYQALWTAAHLRIDVKLIVCHNASYRLLKQNLAAYRQDDSPDQRYPPFFDLTSPRVDFVRLAEALGVAAYRLVEPVQVEAALRTLLDHDGPALLEVVLDRDVAPARD